ncbi:hypothetical protein [Streptomyces sp. NPDC003247]|uniref:hypothetical protein n=1 Tax=Streptomyces sp. NPDC003247 TaxID=3364677 RepID=UPI0036A03C38
MGGASQLRRLRTAYATGTALWGASLLLTVVQGSGSARQTVFQLLILAALLTLLLCTTWQLWHRDGDERGGGRERTTDTGAAGGGPPLSPPVPATPFTRAAYEEVRPS